MSKKIALFVLMLILTFSATVVEAENNITKSVVMNDGEEISNNLPEEGSDSDVQTTEDGVVIPSVDSYLGSVMTPVGSLNNKIGGYTVLAIDTSASMKGTPISVAKNSAIKFCQKLVGADKNNYIAVITINGYSGLITEFTNDIDVLTSKITALKSGGSSGTNISDALNDANALLDKVTSVKTMRNIVILSDGLPTAGSKSTEGPYVSDDYDEYKYANTAYNIATMIKDSTRIYTLGFFHSLSGSEKAFCRRFLYDLQNSGYYEVEETDELEFVFKDLFVDITEDGYIKSAIMTRGDKSYNVLTVLQNFEKDSSETVNLVIEVDWGTSEPGVVYVCQDEIRRIESKSGNMGTVSFGKIFETGEKIYAIAISANGKQVDKVPLGIIIQEKILNGELIGDYKINLFDVLSVTIPDDKPVFGNQKFEVDIGALGVDVELDEETSSFKAVVGVSFEKNEEGKFNLKEFKTLKEIIKEMKKDMKRGTKAYTRHLKKEDFWKKITKSKLKLKSDYETEVTVSGYVEGKIVDGKLVPSEGLIIVNASTEKVLASGQVFVSVFPFCYSIKANGEVEVAAGVKDILPNEGFKPVFSGNFKIAISGEISGGLGVLYVGHIGARGKAKVPIEIALDRNYQKLQLSGEAYFEMKTLGFTLYERELCKGTWTIWETGRDPAVSLMNASENIYDSIDLTSVACAEDRSYAQNPTIWHGTEENIALMGVDYTNKEQRVLQTNTYPDADPLVMSSNGTKVLVWTSDNTSRTALNKSMLVYSVYSKDDNKWSEPKPIKDDGTADYFPCVSDGYVVWQNATKVFENGVSVTDVAKNTDIYMAKFNGDGFDTPIRVTNNTVMDAQPRIASNDAEVTVVWTGNTQDDILGMSGTNSIHSRTYKNKKWSAEEVIKENLNTIASLDVGYVNREAMVAYNLDVDGDLDTINDREIFVVSGGTTRRITDNDVLDSNPVFEKVGTQDALMWYSNNNIYYINDFDKKIMNSIFPDGYAGLTEDFSVSSDGKKTVVVWANAPQNGVSEVNGALYDGRLWSRDINITTTGQYVRKPHVAINQAGVLTIGFLRTQNEETEYYYNNGRTDLCVIDVTPSYDINITDAYIVDEIGPDKEVPVYIDITNSGELAANGITITLKDSKGTTYKEDYTDNILPGENVEHKMVYKIPSAITNGNITVSATLLEGEEYVTDNNSFSVPIGLSDIEITGISTGKVNGTYKVTVNLKNKGYATANGVSLSLYEGSEDGEKISVYVWGNISSQSSVSPVFSIDENNVNFEDGMAVYTVVVSSKNSEATLGNNEETFVIENQEPRYSVTYNYSYNGGTSADVATKTVQAGSYADLTVKAKKDILQLRPDTTDPWEFVGWNTNPDATTALTSYKVTSDVTLYAVFKKNIDVHFYAGADFQNNSSVPQLQNTQTVTIYNNEQGTYIALPTPKTQETWTPVNWRKYTTVPMLGYERYEDLDYGTAYYLTADTNLYATYKRTVYLAFSLEYGESIPATLSATQYLYSKYGTDGVSFELPEAPERSGYTFGGWAVGSINGNNIGTSGSVEIMESTVLYALWIPISTAKYTVTYNYSYNGGFFADKIAATVSLGDTADLTVKAQKSGWEFVGWNTDKDAKTALSSYTVTSNITLYAVYKKQYNIRFNMMNNTCSSTSVTVYNNITSASVNMMAVPIYSGWDALGWRNDTSAGAEEYKTSSVVIVSKDTDFYAVYSRSISLTYNSDGATTTPQTQTALQYLNADGSKNNVSFTLAPAVSKSGYNFAGWAIGSWTGSVYNAGSVITVDQSTAAYAMWTPVATAKYTVTYNYSYNGGTSADKTGATVSSGDDADLTVKAQKSGWEFVGWNIDKDAKTALSSYTVTGNVTLYAVYKKGITVKFWETRVSYVNTYPIYNNESSVEVTIRPLPEKSGWISAGWRDDTVADKEEYVPYEKVQVSQSTEFYAIYVRDITLSYNSNGASTTPQTQTAPQYSNSYGGIGKGCFTLAPAVSKSGYVFDGWAVGSLSGTVYDPGEEILAEGDNIVYAVWSLAPLPKYTVTYNYSYNYGSSADKTSATVTSGNLADLTVKAHRADYEFVGWNTDKKAHVALSSYTVNGDVTLYAIFKRTFYARFYSVTDVNNIAISVYNCENSASVNVPFLPWYSGWTAVGWCDDTLSLTPEYDEQSTVLLNDNKSFYALYSRNITLSYDANGGNTTPPDQMGVQYLNAGNQKQKVSFVLAPAPYRYGYILWGWGKNGNMRELYSPGKEILIDEDTNMKAFWEKTDMLYNIKWAYVKSDEKHIFNVTVPELTQEAKVIVALYDRNLKLIDAVIENFVIGGTTELLVDQKEDAYIAKIFVWDSGMNPLTHRAMCDVTSNMN